MHQLRNFGNTCYINSIVQVLMNTPEFTTALIPYTCKLTQAFNDLCNTGNPEALRRFVKLTYLGRGQHDMHEYLMTLLNLIHETCVKQLQPTFQLQPQAVCHDRESKSIRSLYHDMILQGNGNYDSPVYRLITGQFHSCTRCSNCFNITDTFESFHVLELSLPPQSQSSQLSINNALKHFIKTETIEQYQCDNCHEHTLAHKQLCLWRVPNILIINAKRINPDGSKDDRSIFAPDTIDINPYMSRKLNIVPYSLYAIAYHVGDRSRGHCYSIIRHKDKWIVCDDMNINSINTLPKDNQYLFFYRR
jgi:ubiquitin carboxyl-terminal hydrolase 36/42